MPMRVLTAMENEEPELVYGAATQIWHKIWSHDLDITDPAVITDALDKAGISNERAAYYIAKTQEQEVKDKLKEVTQEGLDCGMFGAPSYIVRQDGQDDVMFFGQGTDYNVLEHFSTLFIQIFYSNIIDSTLLTDDFRSYRTSLPSFGC